MIEFPSKVDLKQIATRLRELLELEHEPVAVSFLGRPPAGAPRFDGRAPSGCSFWRLAECSAFYTAPDDHLECPIGTLTMGFEIPPARREEARKFFATLGDLRYMSPEEFDSLPRMSGSHRFILYEPLRGAAGPPPPSSPPGTPGRRCCCSKPASGWGCLEWTP